jgi:tyrosyl-tRNA synthetase
MSNALDVLQERGFVYQVSDADGLRKAFEQMVTVYCGYDPTYDSLHTGHLQQIMMLAHLQRAGHRPIALVGGGTGMVGDPSDKDSARPVLAVETIDANVAAIKQQLSRFLTFEDAGAKSQPNAAILVDNAEWLRQIGYLEFLRDAGRHFSINVLLDLEFVRRRLEAGGLSYLEFSYILLQAYDYLECFRRYSCTLQVGGSDQWANILAGADLIRRVEGGHAFALVSPLLTSSSGRKYSKSEGTAIYLSAKHTTPYEYYQYWVNTDDADVETYLARFTFLPMDEVRRLGQLQDADLRQAKEILAMEATSLTHGKEEAEKARTAAHAIFFGEGGSLDALPTTEVSEEELEHGIPLSNLLVKAGLFKSNREARQRIGAGGVSVNEDKIEDERFVVTKAHLHDGAILLRKGKDRHRVMVG